MRKSFDTCYLYRLSKTDFKLLLYVEEKKPIHFRYVFLNLETDSYITKDIFSEHTKEIFFLFFFVIFYFISFHPSLQELASNQLA